MATTRSGIGSKAPGRSRMVSLAPNVANSLSWVSVWRAAGSGRTRCVRPGAQRVFKNWRTLLVPHKNKEDKARYNREYYQRNGSKIRAQVKNYRVSDLDRYQARQSNWYANNKDRVRAANLKNHLSRKYGLTVEQYEAMLKAQKYRCAICGGKNAKNRLAVDHCHDTGKVRALLCDPCNQHLGIFERKHKQFEAYLRIHK